MTDNSDSSGCEGRTSMTIMEDVRELMWLYVSLVILGLLAVPMLSGP